jgi:hypothetical protein
VNNEQQELVRRFALADVTALVVAGEWSGHGPEALPPGIAFQDVA